MAGGCGVAGMTAAIPIPALLRSQGVIRLADGSPFSLEHARLPARRLPGQLELPLGGSVYELLAEHYGADPHEAVERIEVALVTAEQAALLDVTRSSSRATAGPRRWSCIRRPGRRDQ